MWVYTHVSTKVQHPEMNVGSSRAGVIGGCDLQYFGTGSQT